VTVTDPRERYDDLDCFRDVNDVDAETFADLRGMEAFESGWVATAAVVDDDGRVLLLRDGDEQAWYGPGGTLQPGESLREGLVREVREETGVTVEPERPYGVTESIHRCSGDELSFTVVRYAARPETTEIPPDEELGVDDEAIETADWFAELPEETLWAGGLEEVLARVERW
jgi:ADP-ribose pyrophosphatase YjhB (NUDIX family)